MFLGFLDMEFLNIMIIKAWKRRSLSDLSRTVFHFCNVFLWECPGHPYLYMESANSMIKGWLGRRQYYNVDISTLYVNTMMYTQLLSPIITHTTIDFPSWISLPTHLSGLWSCTTPACCRSTKWKSFAISNYCCSSMQPIISHHKA